MVPLAPPPAIIAHAVRSDSPSGAERRPGVQVVDMRPGNRKVELRPMRFSRGLMNHCAADTPSFHDVSMPGLSFENADLNHARFENINLQKGKIHNANLSDLEIGGAQLGGAFLHHIGLPPKGTPAYVEGAEQRPLRFEECDLHGSTVKDCDLRGVSLSGCQMQGMKIDGIPVQELLAAYREKHSAPAAPR